MGTGVQNRERFYRKLEELLNAPEGSIRGDEAVASLKSWDSLAVLEFMMMASTDFDREVEPADLAACTTVNDLADVVLERGPGAAE